MGIALNIMNVPVYIESHNIIASLGFSTHENYQNIVNGCSGINQVNDNNLWDKPFQASLVNKQKLNQIIPDASLTHFEKLMLASAKLAIENSLIDVTKRDTLFLLSTTKGNVELLATNNKDSEKTHLWHSANLLASYFKNPNIPQVVSSACISGLMAIIIGQRFINAGIYNNVVVVGADAISKFIVSGFQSFHSLSNEPCKPFDLNRDGLSLGEGAGTVILTNQQEFIKGHKIEVKQGAVSNDANHISGPSRTGEGLLIAIKNVTKNNTPPDFISAHGTATPYNDDMESKAITRANLASVPTNSMKGYFGHTLGAAGVIETIIGIECLKNNLLLKTMGLKEQGVAEDITILKENEEIEIKNMLKLVSGFGGCNAAALFTKHE